MEFFRFVLPSLFVFQVFFNSAFSRGGPINIQGNMVYDELTKNIFMTFRGSSLSDAIRKLIDNSDKGNSWKSPTGTNSPVQEYHNAQRNRGTSNQARVFGTQKDAVSQNRVNNQLLKKLPIPSSGTRNGKGGQSMWYQNRNYGMTRPGSTLSRNIQSPRAGLHAVSNSAAVQQHGGLDEQNAPKNPPNRLTDIFGNPLFGIESEIKFQIAALQAHNRYRQIHMSTAMKLNPELAREAEARAQVLAKHGDISGDETSWNDTKRENLARVCGNVGLTASGAVKRWYDEVCSYDWNSNEVSPNTKSFRQLLCAECNELGIGRATGLDKGQKCTYIVAYYRPSVMSRGSSQRGKISKGFFKQTYCRGGNSTTETNKKQLQTIQKPVIQQKRVLDDRKKLQMKLILKKNPSGAKQINANKTVHQTAPPNNTDINNAQHKLLAGFLNATKHLGNEKSSDAPTLQNSANVTVPSEGTRSSTKVSSMGLSTPRHKYGTVTNGQIRHGNVSGKVTHLQQEIHDDPFNSSGLTDGDILDEDPANNWNRGADVSPTMLQGDYQDSAVQTNTIPPSDDLLQYGDTSPEIDNGARGTSLNGGDYLTSQMEEYHQDEPMGATNPRLPDIDSAEAVKDFGNANSFSNNEAEDELSLKRYQNMPDSLRGLDYGGIDGYQPQDDFTVTMEPEHDEEFSDDRDYERVGRDSILDSYQQTKNDRSSYWGYF